MTASQALDRLDPVLPLPPTRAEQHGFEDYRHGTLSAYAALVMKTGKVQGMMTATQHTSQDFIAILGEANRLEPSRGRRARELKLTMRQFARSVLVGALAA